MAPQQGRRALGPKTMWPGYSYGAVAPPGQLVFVSGQVAMDDDGNVVSVGDIEGQTRYVFQRIRALLEEAGGSLANVVKITTFLTDMRYHPTFTKIRGEVFEAPYPSSTGIAVTALAKPEFLIEIEAIAVI